MTEQHQQQHAQAPAPEPTPLELPAERLREPTADELPVDIAGPDALPVDDSDRDQEEARLFER